MNGVPAPIYYVGPRRDYVSNELANTEIIFQLPYNLPGISVTIQIRQTTPTGTCVGNVIVPVVNPLSPALISNQGQVFVQTA